mmetsp:Transcript_23446/g.50801  ORF Transcript_23446/g.50801 Transcript_23446/m.50801 type:complete len:419 (+) Transcript_23446:318-1574(+)
MDGHNGIALYGSSDDDDKRLFKACRDPELASRILSVKNNDPEAKCVFVNALNTLEERAWTRFGQIIGGASHFEQLAILHCRVNVAELCVGLQLNQSIKKLHLDGIGLGREELSSLVPFLSNNPSLKSLTLSGCNLGSAEIDLLSAALLQHSEDRCLEVLNLRNNHIGDVDLEKLAPALKRNRNKIILLNLENNKIGLRGCTSLTKLLGSQECNLSRLYLNGNSIDDKAVAVLIDSLAKNTKLMTLNLGNNIGITTEGYLKILQLVCNTSCIKGILDSNHHLNNVGMSMPEDAEALHCALGFDDANLLHASLKINRGMNRRLSVKKVTCRRKILWSHAAGNLNIGDSSIVTGVMPCIIAWIGDYSNESNANLIQYHDPPLPKDKIDIVRLGAIYRIVQSRPDLRNPNKHDSTNKKKMWF